MSYLALLATCFFACSLGPLLGIGGGIIVKPVIDALGLMGVSAASFLSGLTVLAMSLFTLARRIRSRTLRVDTKVMLPVAAGAAVGGAAGKALFSLASASLGSSSLVGAAQAAILLALTALAITYTLAKERLGHLSLTGLAARCALGLLSGAAWSFLGIGGGPFNLVLLVFFMGMGTADASQASLLIIAFSQTAGLAYLLCTGNLPAFAPQDLIGMVAMALAGSVAGMGLSRRISDATRDRLYIAALVLIGVICAYNLMSFLHA